MAIPRHTQVGIRSKAFGTYISLNGTGVNHTLEGGWPNTVKTVGHLESWEIFNLHRNDNGTVSFEASTFPNVFLRVDASGVAAGASTPGGVVNAQYGNYTDEKLYIRQEGNSIVAIESPVFPGRYLRADSGTGVNVTGVVRSWERFEIVVVA